MKQKIILFTILGIFLSISPVSAAVFSGSDNYSLPSGVSINNNFYAGGGNLSVSGDVNGDSFLAGGMIQSTGKVSDDLFAAGGNINILSEIGGDLRVAGGSVSINSKTAGEVMVAGGQINFLQNSSIGKDVFLTGGQIILNGTMNGNVYISGGRVELRGIVNGSVYADSASELVVGENAVVKGKLSYKAPRQANVPQTAQISNIEFSQSVEVRKDAAEIGGIIGILWLIGLVATLVTAVFIFLVFKGGAVAATLGTFNNFWLKVLTGFIALIITPIAIILISITILGIPIALVTGLIYILFIILARIGAGAVFGIWLFSLFRRKMEVRYVANILTIIIGIVLLSFIRLIPIIGWFISFIFFLAMFGQLYWWFYGGVRRVR